MTQTYKPQKARKRYTRPRPEERPPVQPVGTARNGSATSLEGITYQDFYDCLHNAEVAAIQDPAKEIRVLNAAVRKIRKRMAHLAERHSIPVVEPHTRRSGR